MIALYLINLTLILFVLLLIRKKPDNSLLRQTGLLEVVWIVFLSLLGLFHLFDVLELKHENQSFMEAAGREKLIFLSTTVGFLIIHFSLFVNIAIRISTQRKIKV
jgi:magnesium-transporting ATPase (P-type)